MTHSNLPAPKETASMGAYFGLLFSTLMLAGLLALSFGTGVTRTIVVSANTRSLEVDFVGRADFWDIGTVTICEPLAKFDRTKSRGDTLCDARRFTQKEAVVEIQWRDNSRVWVTARSRDTWEVNIQKHVDFVKGTRIFLSQAQFESLGVLSFSGFVSMGKVASTGEVDLLLSGDYEIREKPLLGSVTETVKKGRLRLGEQVQVTHESDNSRARVYGYATPSATTETGMLVSVVSEPGDTQISINYFGGTGAIEVAPNWIDRALSSPLILALTILIPLLLAIIQVAATSRVNVSFYVAARTFSRLRQTLKK
ncbi:MAG: hypothetical protein ACRBB0_26270 [Pelagimonas sp.]|uniref:hypothetical protein n=1 Tax=Pelagimonas sp. TaxID=2073170 RepID=UPI003D6B6292